MGSPILDLIESKVGGDHAGTWIHPKLAIKLGRWISVEFELWCDEHIRVLMETGQTHLQQPQAQRVLSPCEKLEQDSFKLNSINKLFLGSIGVEDAIWKAITVEQVQAINPSMAHILEPTRELLNNIRVADVPMTPTQLGEELGLCLLYTSPSPRDGLLSRMPSSA